MIVDKTKENIDKCRCMDCPTYSEQCKLRNSIENMLKLMGNYQKTNHFEKMFCAYEKSNCIYQNNGCLCATCDIYKKYNLKKEDFCTHTGGK